MSVKGTKAKEFTNTPSARTCITVLLFAAKTGPSQIPSNWGANTITMLIKGPRVSKRDFKERQYSCSRCVLDSLASPMLLNVGNSVEDKLPGMVQTRATAS